MSEKLIDLIKDCHTTALEKGWWPEGNARNFPEAIALMHSELSEALEEYRNHGLDPSWFLYNDVDHEEGDVTRPIWKSGTHKAEGIAAELADVLIRVFDVSEGFGIPLEAALYAKMEYNKTRPVRHGGKTC